LGWSQTAKLAALQAAMGRVAADAEAARDATDGAAAPASELPPLALAPSPVELRSQLVALVDSLPDVKQRLQVGAQPETSREGVHGRVGCDGGCRGGVCVVHGPQRVRHGTDSATLVCG